MLNYTRENNASRIQAFFRGTRCRKSFGLTARAIARIQNSVRRFLAIIRTRAAVRRQKVGLAIQQNNTSAPHEQSLQSWLATNGLNRPQTVGPTTSASIEQRLAGVGVTTLERLAQLSAAEAASLVDHIFDSRRTRGTKQTKSSRYLPSNMLKILLDSFTCVWVCYLSVIRC